MSRRVAVQPVPCEVCLGSTFGLPMRVRACVTCRRPVAECSCTLTARAVEAAAVLEQEAVA
jgi:hypothetical protein